VIYKPLSAGDIREAVVRKGEIHGISQQVSASILAWRCACGRQGCQPALKHIVCLSVGDIKPVPVDGDPLYSNALRRHSYVCARPNKHAGLRSCLRKAEAKEKSRREHDHKKESNPTSTDRTPPHTQRDKHFITALISINTFTFDYLPSFPPFPPRPPSSPPPPAAAAAAAAAAVAAGVESGAQHARFESALSQPPSA